MKLTNKHKAAIKSYLRAVAASGITVALAIIGDIRPELAILAGALVAPLAKALDPKSGSEADYGINAK
jgi:5,10-methylenetetrahydrofolate reductase